MTLSLRSSSYGILIDMNIKTFVFSLGLPIFILFPTAATHAVIDLPEGAIGITEDTYADLKQFDGTYCNFDAEDECDNFESLMTGLFDKIIFRAEANGQMYRLVREGGNPYDIFLDRYLPDGMYKSKGSLYWVANGYKTVLERGSVLDTIVERASQDAAAIAPTTESDFDQYWYDCEEIREDWADKDSAFYQNLIELCNEELSYGQWTKDGFQGKMILCVDDGELYYVSTDSHIMELESPLGEHSLYYGLRQEAEKVGRSVKNNIPTYPVSYPERY